MRHVLCGLLVLIALTLQGDAAAGQEALSGVYLVDGIGPEGDAYQGAVEITPIGNVWNFHWKFAPAGEAMGVGVRQGEAIAVVYQTDTGSLGVTLYVRTGETWRGHWTVPGGTDQVFTETLTRSPLRDLDAVRHRKGA